MIQCLYAPLHMHAVTSVHNVPCIADKTAITNTVERKVGNKDEY